MAKFNLTLTLNTMENGKVWLPAVLDDVKLERVWRGAPSKLTFKLVRDDKMQLTNGDRVQLSFNGTEVFKGFVFVIRRDKNGLDEITAYDQIRYLKNKDIYIMTNVTAGDMIRRIAEDFKLTCGDITDTGYVIPKMRAANETLLDTIETMLSMTTENTGKLFSLYDDFGKLTLKQLEDMEVKILLDADTADDFSYEQSIDRDTYDRVKLYYDNKETGKRDVWIAEDSANIKKWGTLQLTESIDAKKPINFKEMADVKLKLHNRVKRTLTIKNAFGDVRVRGGSLVWVDLLIDKEKFTKKVIVDTVTHKFSDNIHLMDVSVKGDMITG